MARLKWCGKSAPRDWQQKRHGKPHREQDQIGTAGCVFRVAVRVGRERCVATHIPEEWSPLRKKHRTRLTGRLTFFFFGTPPPFAGLTGALRAPGQLRAPPLPACFAREGEAGLCPSGWSPGGFAARLAPREFKVPLSSPEPRRWPTSPCPASPIPPPGCNCAVTSRRWASPCPALPPPCAPD